eukprot:GHVT01013510.1.p1 GENE.GHVT01013510.1~~GHVT01013510.1.p1  ORF type:complete len:109 (-),score=11.44 GHVT01013510.1:162-488(-)
MMRICVRFLCPGWGSLSVTTKALIGVVAVLGAAVLAAPSVAMLGRKMNRKRRKHAAKAGRRKDAGRSLKLTQVAPSLPLPADADLPQHCPLAPKRAAAMLPKRLATAT